MLTFPFFDNIVRQSGLTAIECSRVHWQILGPNGVVNFWPTAKPKPKFHMDGHRGKAKLGCIDDAIRLAGGTPPRDRDRLPMRGRETVRVDSLWRVAEAANEYVRMDGRKIQDLPTEQAEAAIRLFKALKEAGFAFA